GRRDTDRQRRDVEGHLHYLGACPGPPDALHQNRQATHSQRFGHGEIGNANQDEQEIHRHGSGNSREPHFHGRSQDGQQQVAEVPWQIRELRLEQQAAGEQRESQGDDQADIDFGSIGHDSSPQASSKCYGAGGGGSSSPSSADEATIAVFAL